jgi:Ca2+-binding RTX toxin-like protein
MSLHRRIALSAVLTGLLCGAAAGPAGAVTAEVSGTTLRVTGGEAGERILVGLRTGFDGFQSYSVAAFGAADDARIVVAPGPGCRPSVFGENNDDVGMAVCAVQPVQDVVVEGRGGDDELQIVTVRQPRYMTIASSVRLDGGAGADAIDADVGPTTVIGGTGNDRITRRCGPGAATLLGGAGNDAVSACAPDTGDPGGGPMKIIEGGPGVDVLDGSAGKDRISGGPGYDVLSGFGGADRLDAGAGPDLLLGGGGSDRLLGRAGRDGMIDHQGRNVMIGATGDDAFSTVTDDGSKAKGRSRLAGGAGDDSFLIRNRSRDRASGGAGRDSAFADRIDVLRSIEDSLTHSPRIPGLPRL